ncbi:MAG: UvrD-helicase domain-containing protein [Spirochaetales bacterium]|nr:UvrD-helicase domain-containing protein [Spirochaetales bacterium]
MSSAHRHTWVEASAGTGKTYWIVQKVIEILKLKAARLPEILLVTFADKATTELKKRIHSELMSSGLDDALLDFELAEIHTIHRFCHRMLTEYNFETGVGFTSELIEDRSLALEMLPAILQDLQLKIPLDFRDGLRKSRFPQYEYYWDSSKWLKTCADLTLMYRPHFDSLSPTLTENLGDLDFRLLTWTMQEAQQRIKSYKQKWGLTSYDDMLLHFLEAIERSDDLKKKIRQRFPFAIVDEFQDTDQVQWKIFRELFLNTDTALMVVGDEKQAIYSFRGADISAYRDARQTYRTLEDKQFDEIILGTSYRSSQALLDSLGLLFKHPCWFGPDYRDVNAAPPQTHKFQEEWPGEAVQLVNLQKESRTVTALWAYHRFIAQEIKELLGGGLTFKRDGENRQLEGGDIAVLVRRSRDASNLEKILRQANIPFSYYKKPGLFTSREAAEWEHLLCSLANPRDANLKRIVLLTGFFAVQPVEIEKFGTDQPLFRELFDRWLLYSREGQWSQMFRSILFDSCALQGERNFSWSRRRENYFQIAEELEQQALSSEHSIVSLRDTLLRLRLEDRQLEDEAALHRRETQTSRVQIMTMHASKGLEFPVVFVCGGLSEQAAHRQSLLTYREETEGGTRRVFTVPVTASPFAFQEQEKERWRREQEEEEKRLYYVACTRAAIRLYLPYYCPPRKNRAFLSTTVYPALKALQAVERTPPAFVESGISAERLPSMAPSFDPPVSSDLLQIPQRSTGLLSFSRILHYRRRRKEHFETDDEKSDEKSGELRTETAAVLDVESRRLRGLEGGSFIHSLLERLDWQSLSNGWTDTADLLLRELYHQYFSTQADEGDRELARGWILKTLSTIPGHQVPVAIAQIEQTIKEMEFIFTLSKEQLQTLKQVEDIRIGRGYLQGSIDLVFSYENRFYLADWKTNFLEDYASDSLSAVMQGYDLQARIYCAALVRFLKKCLPDFDYVRHFGGYYYFFIRGLDPHRPGQGIYFARPEQDMIERIFDR